MTFRTETVLSCSVPPSSRGFERLNTGRDRGLGGAGGGPTGRLAGMAAAGRLQYDCFRFRGVPQESGAIESTVRRLINLRLKGTSTFWEEANAEAVIQLRAAVLSGRWDKVLDRTRAATDGLALGAAGLPAGVEGARRSGRGIAETINEETL